MPALAQDLIAAQEQITALTAERDTLAASVQTLEAGLKAEIDSRAADAVAHKTALDEINGKLTEESKAHADTQTALAEAKTKLADPAYQMASNKGSDKPVPEGAAAAAGDAPKSKQELEAEYRKIDGSTVEGARARAEFRAKYRDELGL